VTCTCICWTPLFDACARVRMPRIDPHQEVIDMIVSSATEEDIGACIDELKAVVAARRIVAIAASKAA
jgi:hypothetical protein